MNAAGIKAAAHAGKTFFAVAGVHAVQDAVPALNLQQFGGVLLFAFGAEILNYLDANPLPQLDAEPAGAAAHAAGAPGDKATLVAGSGGLVG